MQRKEEKYIEIENFLSKIWDSKRYGDTTKDHAISLINQPPLFIRPRLKVIREGSSPKFIIISAPGAVGKTTFAKYSASKKKSYYWDLSKMKLGDNTFIGRLAKYFTPQQLGSVIEDIRQGNINFFLDAFDEAEILSGWDGVEKFIKEISEFIENTEHPNIILFARSETAEMLYFLLEDIEGEDKFCTYEIDYFDEKAAIDFIQKFLADAGDETYKQHPDPFKEALRNIFNTIGRGINPTTENIWEDNAIRSFTGYSPVLQTIAAFMEGQNYQDIANEYASKKSDYEGFKIISKFVHQLLLREQAKVIKGLKNKSIDMPNSWDDWESIYTPENQIKHILELILKQPERYSSKNKSSLPSWLDEHYNKAMEQFLPNHPFLREQKFSSPTFRDYCLGKLLPDSGYESLCSRYIDERQLMLTPLLAYFYALKTNYSCIGKHVGYIYSSASSRATLSGELLDTSLKQSEDDPSKCTLSIRNPDSPKKHNLQFTMRLKENESVRFNRKIYNATILMKAHHIVLGDPSYPFELSEVVIRAKEITLQANELVFNCKDNRVTSILAEDFTSKNNALKPKVIPSDGEVKVFWPGSEAYPWTDFHDSALQQSTTSEADFQKELYALRVIFTQFRKHRKNVFGKQSEYIDNIIIKDSPLRQSLFQYLIRHKIIETSSDVNMYVISEDKLKAKGLNWGNLKNMSCNEAMTEFLLDFRAEESV